MISKLEISATKPMTGTMYERGKGKVYKAAGQYSLTGAKDSSVTLGLGQGIIVDDEFLGEKKHLKISLRRQSIDGKKPVVVELEAKRTTTDSVVNFWPLKGLSEMHFVPASCRVILPLDNLEDGVDMVLNNNTLTLRAQVNKPRKGKVR